MVPGQNVKISIEDRLEQLLNKGGVEVIKGTELFPPSLFRNEAVPREKMTSMMKSKGCDGVFTLTELDVRIEERYVPGTVHTPLPPYRYRYYGSYHSYYTYRYNQVYRPGYISRETTYFFESNFYDLETEDLLWSVQTSAFEPNDVDSWFREYAKILIKQLKKDGIIKD
jgi:hypothetical protein